MQAFPFDSYSFRLISIEQPNPQLVNLMQANGYERFCDLAHFETLWVLRSEKAALDFSISVLPSNCRSK